MGLEGDMTASSRCMTFMERSSYSEAIELNQNFVTGLWVSNNYLDQRVTWEAAAFRPDQAATTGDLLRRRPVGLARPCDRPAPLRGRRPAPAALGPLRRLAQRNATLCQSAYRTTRLQLPARPELRDDDPAGQAAVTNADSNRMIDTGMHRVQATST